MKSNKNRKQSPMFKVPQATTHEGGKAERYTKDIKQLERQVATCMLFEDTFYESGATIACEIMETALGVKNPVEVAALAVKARNDFKLRHVPLFLASVLEQRRSELPGLISGLLPQIIQRADELAEFLSIHAKVNATTPDKIKPILSAQVKKGLATAFGRFDEYRLAKYNRDSEIKMRDVLFLCHAKPKDEAQAALWKRLVDDQLAIPDTWEVALSGGKDKKETFERLLTERKLGYLALLRNLRNMDEAGCNKTLIREALLSGAPRSKALPFRFLTAARVAPAFADTLSDAMVASLGGLDKLPGKTIVMVDGSGSMQSTVSAKSMVRGCDAAGAVAAILREVCEETRCFAWADREQEVSNFRGIPLVEAFQAARVGYGTQLGKSLNAVERMLGGKAKAFDRIVVFTDEQTADSVPAPFTGKGYIVNVRPYKHGLDMKKGWTRINGFSERIVDFIRYEETGSVSGGSDSDD